LLRDITALYQELLARDAPYASASDKRIIKAPQLKGE
jgi:hypothetical protein